MQIPPLWTHDRGLKRGRHDLSQMRSGSCWKSSWHWEGMADIQRRLRILRYVSSWHYGEWSLRLWQFRFRGSKNICWTYLLRKTAGVRKESSTCQGLYIHRPISWPSESSNENKGKVISHYRYSCPFFKPSRRKSLIIVPRIFAIVKPSPLSLSTSPADQIKWLDHSKVRSSFDAQFHYIRILADWLGTPFQISARFLDWARKPSVGHSEEFCKFWVKV